MIERGEVSALMRATGRAIKTAVDAIAVEFRAELAKVRAELAAIPSGPPGPRGERGLQGEVGPRGEQGERGSQGIQGERGLRGEQGRQGDTGADGQKGERGEKGDQGIQGLQGIPGPEGRPGENGRDGRDAMPIPGPAGAQGIQGERGESVVGPQGERGLPGKDAPIPEWEAEQSSDDPCVIKFRVNSNPGGIADSKSTREFTFRFPLMTDAGVYRANTDYRQGNVVSHQGSGWICQKDTRSAPGKSDDWRLFVKRGNDGAEGKPGAEGKQGPPGQDLRYK